MHSGQPHKFGTMIRAARHGFSWSPDHNAFIRICEWDAEAFHVEMCDEQSVPSMLPKDSPKLHYINDDHEEWATILNLSSAFQRRKIERVQGYVAFLVDNLGNEISWRPKKGKKGPRCVCDPADWEDLTPVCNADRETVKHDDCLVCHHSKACHGGE